MILNLASATLGNNIYTKKKFLTNIYLFRVNNRNTRKRSKICLNLIMKTPELWSYFTPFFGVSTADFD